jgi:hypothetical protein
MVDDLTALRHLRQRFARELDTGAVSGDVDDVGRGERARSDSHDYAGVAAPVRLKDIHGAIVTAGTVPGDRPPGDTGGMFETQDELAALQRLMDASLRRSGEHLRSIVTPGERTLTADQLVRVLTGMCTLSAATVTARHEPRISGVDGHFLHARWVFTTSGTAAKAHHLRARPAISVAHIRGDDLGVFVHGEAEFLTPADADFDAIERHLVGHYGSSPSSWGDEIVYVRVRPTWMIAYAFEPAKLLAGLEPGPD